MNSFFAIFITCISLAQYCSAECDPADISIIQDAAYTEAASTWIQTIEGTIKEDRTAVFSAEFRLFCKSQKMQGEALQAMIVYRSGSESYVAKESLSSVGVIANSTGSYQFSFALPEQQVPAGEYKAQIFFQGERDTPIASVSLFHSVPFITGRHMELLALAATVAQAYYVSTLFSAAA